MGAPECRRRFAQAPRRQQRLFREFLSRVNGDYIHVARKCSMLKTVVQEMDVDIEALFRLTPTAITVGADNDWHLGEGPSQKRWFVANLPRIGTPICTRCQYRHACSATPAVTTCQNGRIITLS
jgi:hypothetical protein